MQNHSGCHSHFPPAVGRPLQRPMLRPRSPLSPYHPDTADCDSDIASSIHENEHSPPIHAGWRGTLARITQKAVGRMHSNCAASPPIFWPGPSARSIGPCCYEVAADFVTTIHRAIRRAAALFRRASHPVKSRIPSEWLQHEGLPSTSRLEQQASPRLRQSPTARNS